MKTIQVKCPAKINLTLEIVNKREDGFHNIKSIMQTVDLYDTLDISTEKSDSLTIKLSGDSCEIPYDERNLVHKAAVLFFKTTGIVNQTISIYINKKIPVSAGLAGGSTDAAGTLFGLNEIFEKPLSKDQLHDLCAKLGSDLNVCLEGGCLLATSRGENIRRVKCSNYPVTIIKPKNLGISAKEAYTKYAAKKEKPQNNLTEKMLNALENREDISPYLYNDLEYAIFDDYKELQEIKSNFPNAIMSGSGSAYFVLNNSNMALSEEYQVFSGLSFTPDGVKCNNFVTN